jgi:transcriptional regulator with XRE-family HTH domain
MTPERFRECLALPGWSLRRLAQRLGIDDAAVRKMAGGKKPVPANLKTWLEEIADAWRPLSLEVRAIAMAMGCDQGKFVAHPRGMPPLPSPVAATLQALAEWHAARPLPESWQNKDFEPCPIDPPAPPATP